MTRTSEELKTSGSKKLRSDHNSCRLFCSGVPVRSRRLAVLNSRTISDSYTRDTSHGSGEKQHERSRKMQVKTCRCIPHETMDETTHCMFWCLSCVRFDKTLKQECWINATINASWKAMGARRAEKPKRADSWLEIIEQTGDSRRMHRWHELGCMPANIHSRPPSWRHQAAGSWGVTTTRAGCSAEECQSAADGS